MSSASGNGFDAFFAEECLPAPECAFGNGGFGHWFTDNAGNPAYAYAPPGQQSGDHWHHVGNDRISATAHSGGHVQVYDWSRGPKLLTRWSPEDGLFAGGFSFVEVDGRVTPLLCDHSPDEATRGRVFGTGYFEKAMRAGDLDITEHIEAPGGDDPVLLMTSTFTNTAASALSFSATAFWSAVPLQLAPAPIMTHRLTGFWNKLREQINRLFLVRSHWNPDAGILAVSWLHRLPERQPCPDRSALLDHHVRRVFLAALDGLPEGFEGYCTDGEAFLARSALEECPGALGHAAGRMVMDQPANAHRAVLAFRRTVTLEPGCSVSLRYLYGCAERDEALALTEKYRKPPPETQRAQMRVATPDTPWLDRELRWHSYYLQANLFYCEFCEQHCVDQGSAYSYLQGAIGAPRDMVLSAIPLAYLRPEVAREQLVFLFRSQHGRTGAFPYAYLGHGRHSGALVHNWSTDLELFVFWALAEYLVVTRDAAFLEEMHPFHPPHGGRVGTILDHVRAAFHRLETRVGLGEHGLLRCGSGDWNDRLLSYSSFPPATFWRGESTFNAGLAALVLPQLAAFVQPQDAAMARAMSDRARQQRSALSQAWRGDWLLRGHLGYGGTALGHDRLFLDAQPFAVLAHAATPEQRARLFKAIEDYCVEPQRAGARCLWPFAKALLMEAGSDTNGGTWSAIDAWLAWAWALEDPARAWDFFLKTTLAARAEAYPDTWYGIWSGPDSFNADAHARAGDTFDYSVTPMTDFPVMNSNRHAGPLLAAIKLAGFRPDAREIVVDPLLPLSEFAVHLPVIGVAVKPGGHHGYYVPQADGPLSFAVRPPDHDGHLRLTVNDRELPSAPGEDGLVRFEVEGVRGTRVTWELWNLS